MTPEAVHDALRRLDVTLERIERSPGGAYVTPSGVFITEGDAHLFRRALRLCDDAAIRRLGLHREEPRKRRKHPVPYSRTPAGIEAIGGRLVAVLAPGERVTVEELAHRAGLSPGYIETPLAAVVRGGKLDRTRPAPGKPALYWRPE